MPKIEMKINRYITHIGKDDLILDNGNIIQVPTQKGHWGVWDYAPLQMSKKLFKLLKDSEFIYIDEALTEKANARYKKPFLTYYRFDIDKLIENGYPIVKE